MPAARIRPGFLVPNGLSFSKQEPQLNSKYHYTEKEKFVHKYDKRAIEDMTAPKHRYIKDLVNEAAIEFANQWVFRYRKKINSTNGFIFASYFARI